MAQHFHSRNSCIVIKRVILWYFVSILVIKSMMIPGLVFVKLNRFTLNSDLTLQMYEFVIDVLNGEATMFFIELSFTLTSEEAERIGECCARMDSHNSSAAAIHRLTGKIILSSFSFVSAFDEI